MKIDTKQAKRVLIVDDHAHVRRYARAAFRDFFRWVAPNTERAAVLVRRAQYRFDLETPFDIVCCDINMPYGQKSFNRTGRIGLCFMSQFHIDFPEIPIICHSDDFAGSQMVPFTHFVEKEPLSAIYSIIAARDPEQPLVRFEANEALLRACALDILEGKISFEHLVAHARERGPCKDISSLSVSTDVMLFIIIAKKYRDFSKLFAFARAGYITDEQLVEILRFCLPNS